MGMRTPWVRTRQIAGAAAVRVPSVPMAVTVYCSSGSEANSVSGSTYRRSASRTLALSRSVPGARI
jgi:hypothetical protein